MEGAPDAVRRDGTAQKDLVASGVGEALGRVRSEALVKDYTHVEGYKKLVGQRREAMGVEVAGQGESVGKDTQTAYVDEREEWKGGGRLVRRYENGAVYVSVSTQDYGGLKVEMTRNGDKTDVKTVCDRWYAVNGWEPVLAANTPRSDLFLDRLSSIVGGDSHGVEETISTEKGIIIRRRMSVDVHKGWRGNHRGVDVNAAAAMDYEYIKGGTEGGKDIAYARIGFWESAGGILDGVSRDKAMKYIEDKK